MAYHLFISGYLFLVYLDLGNSLNIRSSPTANLLQESPLFCPVLAMQPPDFLGCSLLWQEIGTRFGNACNDNMTLSLSV